MPYSPPAGNVANFNFRTPYSPPAGNLTIFNFSDASTQGSTARANVRARVASTASIAGRARGRANVRARTAYVAALSGGAASRADIRARALGVLIIRAAARAAIRARAAFSASANRASARFDFRAAAVLTFIPPHVRVTQAGIEAWLNDLPYALGTQFGVEPWFDIDPLLRATQIGLDVWQSGAAATQPLVFCTQSGIEVWRRVPDLKGRIGSSPPAFPAPPPSLQAWPFEKGAQLVSTVQRSVSGREWRALDQPIPIWSWTLSFPVLRDAHDIRASNFGGAPEGVGFDDYRRLVSFFLTVKGQDIVFAFEDPTDNKTTGELIFTGDGVTRRYQLTRAMGGFHEPIYLPKDFTALYYGGVLVDPALYAVDFSTGVISAAAAAAGGAAVTADFTYYFPTRFSDDTQEFENFLLDLWQLGRVKIQSVPTWWLTDDSIAAATGAAPSRLALRGTARGRADLLQHGAGRADVRARATPGRIGHAAGRTGVSGKGG